MDLQRVLERLDLFAGGLKDGDGLNFSSIEPNFVPEA
jgi:hypothetical protein